MAFDRSDLAAGLALAVGAGLLAWGLSTWTTTPRPDAEPDAPTRLVALSPPITETVMALGAGAQLVGRSEWCTWPPEVTALPTAGSALAPDLETLARLAPTLVLTEAVAAGAPDDLAAVAPTEVLPWLTLDDVTASIDRLGAITGNAAEADALIAQMRAGLDVPPPDDAPRVLVAFGGSELTSGELWFVRDDSLHGRAIRAAGLRNVVEGALSEPPVMSLERVVTLDPDLVVVVMATDDLSDDACAEVVSTWATTLPTLAASRSGRIGVLSGQAILSTGPRILDFVDALKTEAARLGASEP